MCLRACFWTFLSHIFLPCKMELITATSMFMAGLWGRFVFIGVSYKFFSRVGSRVMLTSWNEFVSVPSSCVFWKSLCTAGVSCRIVQHSCPIGQLKSQGDEEGDWMVSLAAQVWISSLARVSGEWKNAVPWNSLSENETEKERALWAAPAKARANGSGFRVFVALSLVGSMHPCPDTQGLTAPEKNLHLLGECMPYSCWKHYNHIHSNKVINNRALSSKVSKQLVRSKSHMR